MSIVASDIYHILPELIVIFGAFSVLLVELFYQKDTSFLLATLSIFSLCASAVVLYYSDNFLLQKESFIQFFYTNQWIQIAKLIILLGGVICVHISRRYLQKINSHYGEYYFLVLIAVVSAMFLISTRHLLMIFLALETVSLASYILCAINRNSVYSTEAGLKYFMLGSFATAFILLGIAFVYGGTYSLYLPAISEYSALQGLQKTAILGLLLIIIGFAFKFSLIPFHVWTPDVYQGAPFSVVAFISIPIKISVVVAFFNILLQGFRDYEHFWNPILQVLAIATIILGSIIALTQNDLKRLLAFSSITHTGYMLIGIITYRQGGLDVILYYFLVYTVLNLGIFASLISLCNEEPSVLIENIKKIFSSQPAISTALIIFTLGLAGLPLTAGFTGKFFLFYRAFEGGYFWLLVCALVGSAISIYYYFRIGIVVYFKNESENLQVQRKKSSLSITIFLLLILTFLLVFVTDVFIEKTIPYF